MKLRLIALPGILMFVLVACSSTPPREREALALAQYEAAAGEPVDSFWFQGLHSWESLGEDRLLVRSGPSKAFLLTVERPCTELPWANSIALTSSTSSVHAKFDNVLVGQQRCRITEIRPVDESAVRRARAAGRE